MTNETITAGPAGLADLKQAHRGIWASGDYAAVAERMIDDVPPRHLMERIAIEPGMEVLDIAAGTGNAAIRAAALGARVTALDLTPELFDRGRERAAAAGVEIDWVEGDAEDLPFEDGRFDRVISDVRHPVRPPSRGVGARGGARHTPRRRDRPDQLDAAGPHRPDPQGGRRHAAEAARVRVAAAALGRGGPRRRAVRHGGRDDRARARR